MLDNKNILISNSALGFKEVLRQPEWLRREPGSSAKSVELKKLLRKSKLTTVCEEARCPNISDCFSRGTATFMLLGDICTRGCRFCSVKTGKPSFTNIMEDGDNVASAVKDLGLKHVVLTSVARDDLADGGAEGFVFAIRAIKKTTPAVTIEVLIPDLRGDAKSLKRIVSEDIVVLNHNLETVPRLYRKVRPGSNYQRSLNLLKLSKEINPLLKTKTGIMLGLGEEKAEVESVIKDSANHFVDIFTAGQYMRPSLEHLPVEKYLTPNEFDELAVLAIENGIKEPYFGALVRSSFNAEEKFYSNKIE